VARLCVGVVPVYWDPSIIIHDHEGTTYTVSSPQHIAVLHSMRDVPRATALEYLRAHADSRTPVEPIVFTVHDGWQADVVGQWPAEALKKNRVRYTMYDWRKHEEYHSQPDWIACQHYFSEQYDLKEVLDPEGNVLSSEVATDCLEKMSGFESNRVRGLGNALQVFVSF
jgi:hypothetical protein